MRLEVRSRVVPWVLTLLLGALAFLPICDLHFDCGCRFPGLGGHAHCDIHSAGPPDCPWCDHTWIGYAAMAFSSLAGLIAVAVAPGRLHWVPATLLGFAGFLLAALLAGVVTSLALGRALLSGL